MTSTKLRELIEVYEQNAELCSQRQDALGATSALLNSCVLEVAYQLAVMNERKAEVDEAEVRRIARKVGLEWPIFKPPGPAAPAGVCKSCSKPLGAPHANECPSYGPVTASDCGLNPIRCVQCDVPLGGQHLKKCVFRGEVKPEHCQ